MDITTLDPDKIVFAGDWHGSIDQAAKVLFHAQAHNATAVIQLGDFGIWHDNKHGNRFLDQLDTLAARHNTTVFFVDGNHEDFDHLYSYPLHTDGTRPIRPNVIHLPRGLRFTWGGVRYLALGGAHSVDKDLRTPGKDWWPQEWVTDEEIEAVIADGQADIVLMHDSPAGAPNPVLDDPNNQGHLWFSHAELLQASIHRQRLAPAIEAADPVMIFHGHYHRHAIGIYFQPSGTRTTVFSLDEGRASLNRHMTYTTREALQQAIEDGRSTANDIE